MFKVFKVVAITTLFGLSSAYAVNESNADVTTSSTIQVKTSAKLIAPGMSEAATNTLQSLNQKTITDLDTARALSIQTPVNQVNNINATPQKRLHGVPKLPDQTQGMPTNLGEQAIKDFNKALGQSANKNKPQQSDDLDNINSATLESVAPNCVHKKGIALRRCIDNALKVSSIDNTSHKDNKQNQSSDNSHADHNG